MQKTDTSVPPAGPRLGFTLSNVFSALIPGPALVVPLPFVKIASTSSAPAANSSARIPTNASSFTCHRDASECPEQSLGSAVNQSGCCLAAFPTSGTSGKPSIQQFGQARITTITTTTTMMKAITMQDFQRLQQESQRNQEVCAKL